MKLAIHCVAACAHSTRTLGRFTAEWSVIVCILFAASSANAQHDMNPEYLNGAKPFNPATCKTGDKKYVYWAAKDQVFKFKLDASEPLYPRGWWVNDPKLASFAQKEVPAAPVPTEAEGCYGNPLRGGAVPYMEAFAEAQIQKLFGRKMRVGTAGHSHGFSAVPDFRRGSNSSAVSKLGFQKSTRCWERAPGFHECLRSKGTDRQDYLINRAFKVDKALLPKHAQVNDLYFSSEYDNATGLAKGIAADSGFELFGNVLLDSSLKLFPNEIDLLIPYHRSVIGYVLNAHVPGYQWNATQPKLTNSKKHAK